MWSELSGPWQACLRLVWESYCEGSVPIAAVVVDSNSNIISDGRNRNLGSDSYKQRNIVGGPLAHAEINALLGLDWDSVDVYSLEIFTTVEPCPLCIGAICMSGVKKIRYAARDAWAGSVNLLDATPYMKWKGIKSIPPDDPRLEALIHMILVDGQLKIGHPRVEDVLSKWSEHYPDDVRKGRILHERGELDRMKNEGFTVERVINGLDEISIELDE